MILQVQGNEIFVEDIKPANYKKTIFFIHGWPLSHKVFEYQYTALAYSGVRCVSLDLPGYGNSSKLWYGENYDEMCDIVAKVIRALSLNNITLLGYSMGGALAAKYAAQYNEGNRVTKLILLSAACPCFIKRQGQPYGMTEDQLDILISNVLSDKPRAFSDFSKMMFEQPVSPEFKEWFSKITNQCTVYNAVFGLKALRDEDLRNILRKIDMPTAIFHGVKDRICPVEFAGQMKDSIPNSIYVPFENSGHGIFYEEKDKLHSEIVKFIND